MEGPPTPPSEPTPTPTSTGLDPKLAALLSYLLSWVTGLIFYLIEKDDKYVRFHAMQSIILGVVWIIVIVVLQTLFSVFIFIAPALVSLLALLIPLLWLGMVVLTIVLMVKAYQGEKFKLPVIGDMAERYA